MITLSHYVIPFIRFYWESGEFTVCRKILGCIKRFIFQYVIIIIIMAISLISQNIIFALFIVFNGINLIYALLFLAHSMIDIPQKMNIHSDIGLSIEYYEYKADKKLTELTKYHERIKNTYYRCQKTLKYIENIEYYLESDRKENS